jgi:crotonobetainyl-CoA:carnitine CoA-transferase CaiB-like acyl-CoA transferase
MEGLGLGYRELQNTNPGVIVASITPFGQTGPHRDYKTSDLVSWAMGGLLAHSGDPDRPPVRISHLPFSYLMAGMDAAWAIAIALYWRGISGKGQHIDISIQASVVKSADALYEWELSSGIELRRGSSGSNLDGTGIYLRYIWPAKDGYVRYRIYTGQFGAKENRSWVKWLDEEGMADGFLREIDWDNFDWRTQTPEQAERIQGQLATFFQTKTKVELAGEARKRGIMLETVNTPIDVLQHPQLEARGFWHQLDHPELGTAITYPARFALLSESPARLRRRAPLVGEHNQEIYRGELGFAEGDLVALKACGAI